MSAPVYSKQYIRFAETFQVAQGTEVNQFRVVQLTGTPGSHPPLFVEQSDGTGSVVGVGQYTLSDNVPPTGFATDKVRMLTVATSGLLLVSAESGANVPVAGDIGLPLEVNNDGQAVTAGSGTAVLIGGVTPPVIRDVIAIGGQDYILASFS